jgi:methanogenic corrinoid protein MtbC1
MRLGAKSLLKGARADVEVQNEALRRGLTVNGLREASFRRPAARGHARHDGGRDAGHRERWRLPLLASGHREQSDSDGASAGPQGQLDAVAGVENRPAPATVASRKMLLGFPPWLALGAAAATGAALFQSPVLIGGCVALLAGAAAGLGWCLGEARRVALRQQVEGRTSELRRALSELEISQAEMVRRLSMAVEFRDEDTGAHIERIGRFSRLLAEQIGMEAGFCERISHAAPLHDVGKVAIPDAILLKPGPLTAQERAIVETHAEEGYRLVRGSSSAILEMAATIALSHQEKWDGSGYPRGLAGENIPIEGRIVSIADVFDALTSDRVYRKAFPLEEAITIMREQRGRHFDPVLLDAFMEVLESSGADARGQVRADPGALAESALQTYASALQRGDAETAESAIAEAIEDGLSPAIMHGEVIAPALRRVEEMIGAGALDSQRGQLAVGITRRVLATLYRYMLGGSEPSRERVLLVGIDGEAHPLELQMMHDQLSAAGYRTVLIPHVRLNELAGLVEGYGPDVVLLGATGKLLGPEIEDRVRELQAAHGEIPVALAGAPGLDDALAEQPGIELLERIDQAVPVVEALLDERLAAAAR